MKRRTALAIALLFTTIAGFFIVAYGNQSGFFGGRDASEDSGAAQPAVGETSPSSVPAVPTPTVRVIEQYVYEDVAVPAPDSGGTAAGPTSSGGTTTGAPTPPASKPTGGTGAPEDGSEAIREEGLNGFVVAVAANSFTLTGTHVGDAAIAVTPGTQFTSALDGSFSMAEVRVGSYLKAKVLVAEGDRPTGPNGSWEAVSVREDILTQALNGTVLSVSGDRITLSGTRLGQVAIVVTSSTKYESEIDGSLQFADIVAGMYLKTKVVVGPNGATGPSGSWVAVSVKEATP